MKFSSLVSRLRNKEVIPAEGFQCVTVFFSSLIDFGAFCSKSTPLLIVELLNRVYSTFDTILQDFDVYKVETIKDGYMVSNYLIAMLVDEKLFPGRQWSSVEE